MNRLLDIINGHMAS